MMRPCPAIRTPVGETGVFKVAGMAKICRSDVLGARESAMFNGRAKKKEAQRLGLNHCPSY